jgi:hypothetical protein
LSNRGHCVAALGYDSRNLYVVSWGRRKSMNWQFYIEYADEAFAVLSNDFLSKKHRAVSIWCGQGAT